MPISLIHRTFMVAFLVISVIFSFMKYDLLLPPYQVPGRDYDEWNERVGT